MITDLHDRRRDYQGGALPETINDPWAFFSQWFEQAVAEQQAGRLAEATAMVLSTADSQGRPTSRVVLAKAFGAELSASGGVDFYTTSTSLKGEQIAENDHVCLLFFWPTLNRQVRFEGRASLKPVAEADTYFAQRPKASQVAAVVSQQSRPRASRAELERAFAVASEHYAEREVPRPDDWVGYRVVPTTIEFWQGLPSRLHDRVVCRFDASAWSSGRLDP